MHGSNGRVGPMSSIEESLDPEGVMGVASTETFQTREVVRASGQSCPRAVNRGKSTATGYLEATDEPARHRSELTRRSWTRVRLQSYPRTALRMEISIPRLIALGGTRDLDANARPAR